MVGRVIWVIAIPLFIVGLCVAEKSIEDGEIGEAIWCASPMLAGAFMSCTMCDYINNEIMRKAKEVADALLAMVTPERDALTQDGKAND